MSTVAQTGQEQTSREVQEPKNRVIVPKTKIEGWVTVADGRTSDDKDRRFAHQMHGMVLPGIGNGLHRRTGERVPTPRNRFLLPDKMSHQWFKDLMDTEKLPEDKRGITLRMHVTILLNDNIAFVKPSAYTLNQAMVEWRARQLKERSSIVDRLVVDDDKSLCYVYYTRGLKNGQIAKIFPNDFSAIALMRNGYFYKLTGAERLRHHIGDAGTNGVVLGRDIETTMRYSQIYDYAELQSMMDDPNGFVPEE